MNWELWTPILIAVLSGGGLTAFITYFGVRGKNRVDASGQLINGWEKQVSSYEKQATQAEQRAIQAEQKALLAEQQTNAMRFELHELRGKVDAKIGALEKKTDDQELVINVNERRIWSLERDVAEGHKREKEYQTQLERYQQCASTTCPFRRNQA